MRIPVTEVIGGTTLRATWISSGTTVSSVYSTLLSGSESIVNTATPVDSGDGHFFAIHPIPTTPGWYVNEWIALIAANTYVDRQFIRAIRPEVD
jgi:hypothetical protein